MSDLIPFAYSGQQVRTVEVDGEPWFVAADVCAVLGLTNVTEALRGLDEDEFSTTEVVDSAGRRQRGYITNEPGLYSLILRSRKPEAKAFKRWITHEVLPALRQSGRYEVAAPMDELELAERYVASIRARRELVSRVAELEPAANAWNTLATADGDFDVAGAAKVLSRDPAIRVGRDRLFTVLAERGWVFRDGTGRWAPKQPQIDNGRLSVLPQSHYHPRTGELVLDPPQVRVTVKGLTELHRSLGGVQPLTVPERGAV